MDKDRNLYTLVGSLLVIAFSLAVLCVWIHHDDPPLVNVETFQSDNPSHRIEITTGTDGSGLQISPGVVR